MARINRVFIFHSCSESANAITKAFQSRTVEWKPNENCMKTRIIHSNWPERYLRLATTLPCVKTPIATSRGHGPFSGRVKWQLFISHFNFIWLHFTARFSMLFRPLVLGFDGVVWGFLMDNKSTGHTHWFGSNQEIHSRFDCSDQLVVVYLFFFLFWGPGCCIYLWGRRSFEKRRWWTAITNGLGPAAVTVAASLHAPIEDATPTAFGIHWPLSPRNDSRRQYPLFYAFDIILRWWSRCYWSCVGRDRWRGADSVVTGGLLSSVFHGSV